jgi:hypothetical protein
MMVVASAKARTAMPNNIPSKKGSNTRYFVHSICLKTDDHGRMWDDPAARTVRTSRPKSGSAFVRMYYLINSLPMNNPSFYTACILAGLAFLLGSATQKDTFDKITVREFQLVDENGTERASIKVEAEGQVVLRLRDKEGAIRVKMGADEAGSGLVLLDRQTNPAIHALSKQGGALTVLDKDGKQRSY